MSPLITPLLPFKAHGAPSGTDSPQAPRALTVISAISVERPSDRPAQLQVTFRLSPNGLSGLHLPLPGSAPRRRDGLWNHTCLECFFASPGHSPYWEVNLSPSGDWNIYRLESYRKGLQTADEYTQVSFKSQSGDTTGLQVTFSMPLPAALQGMGPLEWNVTAVIQASDGSLSYWAPRHGHGAPDFHDRRLWMQDPLL